jgi:hypothetical protein
MWQLTDDDDAELLAALRRHARVGDELVVWTGPGWRSLVRQGHDDLVTAFPDYELLAVKQKYGELAFQAGPRPWADRGSWPADDLDRVHAITRALGQASARVCEWCGAPGELRPTRRLELTLCDACDRRFDDPPA